MWGKRMTWVANPINFNLQNASKIQPRLTNFPATHWAKWPQYTPLLPENISWSPYNGLRGPSWSVSPCCLHLSQLTSYETPHRSFISRRTGLCAIPLPCKHSPTSGPWYLLFRDPYSCPSSTRLLGSLSHILLVFFQHYWLKNFPNHPKVPVLSSSHSWILLFSTFHVI